MLSIYYSQRKKSLWNGKSHIMILTSVLMPLGNFPRYQAYPFSKQANVQIYTLVLWEYVESTEMDVLAYLLIDIYCLWYICQPNYEIWNAPVRKENLFYQIPLFWTLKLFFWWIHMSQMKVIVIIHLLTCIG